ncbi:MAG: pseudaminic acid synthase [Bacteroidia bacterium]|nr:pseudaminic acid synthase [Bacteroidia bacterium]
MNVEITKDIKLGTKLIGSKHPPFIIAEMSGNHNHSLEKALSIIDAAAESGADAIKLQTYTADTLTIKGAYTISDKKSLWFGRELYDLYNEAYTPWEWHEALFKRAKERGILCFSTPFDESSVDFLESLGNPFYKIASFENNYHHLLSKVAKTGKPVIMSTGITTLSELSESVSVLKENACTDLILLKCTSSYPASPESSNLRTIPEMQNRFSCPIGLSDHTMGIGVAVAAVALGAVVVEKHFTLSRAEGGVDSAFSLEPHELKQLVEESKRAWLSIGNVSYEITEEEKKSISFKRSIYISANIKKGEVINHNNIRIIRPGFGIAPKFYEQVLDKTAKADLKAGTPLTWDLIT